MTPPKPRPDNAASDHLASLQATALDLLARREHSVHELARKLAVRGHAPDDIDGVLQSLQFRGLLSDERFAEQFVSSRLQRGSGPFKIQAELRQRGVDDVLAEQALAAAGADWRLLAAAAREKRFGKNLPADYAERARQARFLQQRGFSMEQIRAALKGDLYD